MNSKFHLTVFLFIVSCALHPPLSEQVIFEKAEEKSDLQFTMGFGLTGNAYGGDIAEKALPELDYKPARKLGWLRRVGVASLAVGIGRHGFWSLGLSPGVLVGGIGVDGTFLLAQNWYLTAAVNMNENGELILQRRMALRNGVGWSMGFVTRSDVLVIGDNTLDDPDFLFRTVSIGVRFLGSVHGAYVHARGFITLGYEWLFGAPMARAGFIIAL